MDNLMKQAQKMQVEMARVQEELKEDRVEASAGGGMIKVVMTGDMRVDRVVIDPAAVDPDDVSILEDMIAAAVSEASRQAQDLASEKMAAVTGGMGIPGLM